MLKYVIVVIALLAASATATNVKKCKNGQPFPLSVEVVGCTDPPCDVVKGTTAVMYVNFLGAKAVTQNLKAKVRATTLGITVPYVLPEDIADVCANLMHGASCPIYKSEDVTYQFNFPIDSSYPEIGVAVEISLNDENNESAACFICNIKVKKGAAKPLKLE